ncbi:MAG: transcriptional regulator, partial [Micavibrio aeruginosavorus]
MVALKNAVEKDVGDKKKGRANWIDKHVGQALRNRRTILGLTQQDLALKLGITFQQLQKYENGTNRVSAGRLYEIAGTLGVPVGFFFEECEHNAPKSKADKGR